MGDLGYVAAGYLATALALGGYVARLLARARRARRRTAALAGRPLDRPGPG
ncbi:MAG TPA: hypothetical protein VGA45_12295 [Actinomycetota bacterium]|jgi:hypothetical protein